MSDTVILLFVFYALTNLKYLYIRYKKLALLEMEQTSLLAISTPATDGAETVNFYSSMMDAKLHGKPMFKTLKVGLACEACIAAGLATSCSHMEVSLLCISAVRLLALSHNIHVLLFLQSFRPPWKSR